MDIIWHSSVKIIIAAHVSIFNIFDYSTYFNQWMDWNNDYIWIKTRISKFGVKKIANIEINLPEIIAKFAWIVFVVFMNFAAFAGDSLRDAAILF